jgi:hypothetical protein
VRKQEQQPPPPPRPQHGPAQCVAFTKPIHISSANLPPF